MAYFSGQLLVTVAIAAVICNSLPIEINQQSNTSLSKDLEQELNTLLRETLPAAYGRYSEVVNLVDKTNDSLTIETRLEPSNVRCIVKVKITRQAVTNYSKILSFASAECRPAPYIIDNITDTLADTLDKTIVSLHSTEAAIIEAYLNRNQSGIHFLRLSRNFSMNETDNDFDDDYTTYIQS